MSRSQAIRDFLIANPGPKLTREIAAGIGADTTKTGHTIGVMFRDAWLGREGTGHAMRYFLIRTESKHRPKMTHEEYLAKRRDQERAREQAKGRMTLEQYQAWLVEKRAQKAAEAREKAAESARLRKLANDIRRTRKAAELAEAKAAAKAKAEHAAQDKRDAARQVIAMRTSAIAAPPVVEEWPCTEAFLRENRHDPAKYQVLKPGEWSAPLRFQY